jgi:hypothetical protein
VLRRSWNSKAVTLARLVINQTVVSFGEGRSEPAARVQSAQEKLLELRTIYDICHKNLTGLEVESKAAVKQASAAQCM